MAVFKDGFLFMVAKQTVSWTKVLWF